MNHSVYFFGDRLREERNRLGMSQPVFGEIAGVTKKTQMLYEAGERHPDVLYLAALQRAGVDVMYMLTGTRSAQAINHDEMELLNAFRAAPAAVKAAAIGALKGGSAPVHTKQTVHGSIGQQAGGDVINQQGVKLDVGKKAGGRRKR